MPLSDSVMIGSDDCGRLQPAGESAAGAAIHLLAAQRPLRVLVVDNNKDAADSLCMLAEIWGFQGERAYDGFAALEMIPAYRPDVLLLDIGMPKMHGCRLAEEIRGQGLCKESLLIAITGHTGPDYRLLCARAGFDHFLIKPAEPSAIKKLLDQQCGRRSCRSAAGSVPIHRWEVWNASPPQVRQLGCPAEEEKMFRLLKHWFGFTKKDSAAVCERAAGDRIDLLDRLNRDCIRLAMDHEHSASAATSPAIGIVVVDDEACVRDALDAGDFTDCRAANETP